MCVCVCVCVYVCVCVCVCISLSLSLSLSLSHHCVIPFSSSLDELLEGGFYAGEVYELTGETASGKSQVRLLRTEVSPCVR